MVINNNEKFKSINHKTKLFEFENMVNDTFRKLYYFL